MRKKCWILIGKGETKKSSTARGLVTAARGDSCAEVEDWCGLRFRIKVCVSAYQEQNCSIDSMINDIDATPRRCANEDENNLLNKNRYYNALVVLRYEQGINNQPEGKEYVERLISEDWDIEAIISLGAYPADWIRDSGIPYAYIIESTHLPGSVVAARAREFFGWK